MKLAMWHCVSAMSRCTMTLWYISGNIWWQQPDNLQLQRSSLIGSTLVNSDALLSLHLETHNQISPSSCIVTYSIILVNVWERQHTTVVPAIFRSIDIICGHRLRSAWSRSGATQLPAASSSYVLLTIRNPAYFHLWWSYITLSPLASSNNDIACFASFPK